MELLDYGYDLGLQDYPIYDEAFRAVLNQRIIDHFYLREIGAETPDIFIFYLNRTMREEMPTLNPVFAKLADKDYDPFENIDTTTDYHQTGSDSNSNQSKAASQSDAKTSHDVINSNTPQTNLESKELRMKYGNTGLFENSDATSSDSSTSDAQGQSSSLADYIGHTHGQQGQLKFDVLRQWLDAYVNPLHELFDVLEPCFMQLYTDHYNGL